MSKLNIFKKEWIDIIFEGRNKSYGAYQLRSQNPKITSIALFLGIALFGLAISSPMLISMAEGQFGIKHKKKELDKVIEVINMDVPPPPVDIPPPPPEDVPPPPPPPEAEKSIRDEKKFTDPKVVEDHEVTEEIAKQEDFKEADPGKKDREGDPEQGAIKTGEETGGADKGTGAADGTGEDEGQVFVAVQVKAEPPGGMAAFQKQFISRFRTPDIDSSVKRLQVIVMFIVEKDGSFTDIKVLRDPGYGAGKEAVRVLKNMPKWKPAVQNGRNVRSQFTLPITIQVQ